MTLMFWTSCGTLGGVKKREDDPDDEDAGTELQAAHLPTRTLRVPAHKWDDYVLLSRRPAHPSLCFLPVLSPLTSRTVLTWKTFITIFDMTYTAFLVPLGVAFSTLGKNSFWGWMGIINLIAFIAYCIDMVFEFHTGVIVKVR